MPKFRKKPVVVFAEQFVPEKNMWPKGVTQTIEGTTSSCPHCSYVEIAKIFDPHVHTAHQNQIVVVVSGDWILPEPDGIHYYPVKPDIFANTYEELPNEPHP